MPSESTARHDPHTPPALTDDRRTDRALVALARLLAEIARADVATASAPAPAPPAT